MGNSVNREQQDFETLQTWLGTPLGASLLQQEARVVEEAFDGMFGEQCLQLGYWGDPKTFVRLARTQRCAVISEFPRIDGVSAIGQLHRLPVQDDSIDVVILPHTLDYSDRPHAVLREVHGDESRWSEFLSGMPMGRAARVEEVADVVSFLASERASFITGQVIYVDGGRHMRGKVYG